MKKVRRCPRCGGELQQDENHHYCVICGFKRPRIYTYAGESRFILAAKPRLGSSLETTLREAEELDFELNDSYKGYYRVNKNYLERLRRAQKSYVKSIFRNPREKNLWYFVNITCAKHPEIGKWFSDPTVPKVIRDDVERLYTLLLGKIQGKRPEYIMTVLCTLIYDAHNMPFDPPSFLNNLNIKTFIEYYDFIWKILAAQKLTTLRTPHGIIQLRKRQFYSSLAKKSSKYFVAYNSGGDRQNKRQAFIA